MFYRLMNEMEGEEGYNGAGGAEGSSPVEGGPASFEGSSAGGDEPEPKWLRDFDEDTGYSILKQAQQLPDHMRGLESRLFGRFGPLQEKLNTLEKSLSTRVSLNTEGLKKALDAYDGTGALSEALLPALSEALNVSPLDENTIRPFIEPLQQSLTEQMGEKIVLAHYSPKQIAGIIPEISDGRWNPQSQRHKDFVDWYSQQGYETHQALNEFGPDYVHALRQFESWEKDRNKEREKAAGAQSTRLAGGQQPSSQGRRTRTAGPQTAEEFFLAGYNEAD
jgi:hypothetical protein